MTTTEIIAALRSIRHHPGCGGTARALLCDLEHTLAGTEPEDFGGCPVEGYDTVLSYLNRTNPEAFELLDEPVHGTICDGIALKSLAYLRGINPLRVTPCAHMRRRFPKATKVNAYPTRLFEEFYG